jgi:hypothetical protein
MAPTKAKATYVVTTLNLLTKGLTAIGRSLGSGLRSGLPAKNARNYQSVPGAKSQRCCRSRAPAQRAHPAAWLKIHEINALKSP